jgi:tetratricopeptide (TPR) repeat protein
MKRILFLFLAFLTLSAHSSSENALFDQANQLYAEGQFQQAAATYEQILIQGKESDALYFNLGNAYYKSGLIPEAILNYERALRLNPQDEDIRFNLEAANMLAVDQLDAVPVFFLSTWIQNFRQSFSLNTWSILALISFLLMLIAFAFYRISGSRSIRKVAFGAALTLSLLVLISLVSAQKWYQELNSDESAILFSPSAMVKASPDKSGTDLFLLHEGTKLEILDAIGDWSEIRLVNGNEGWIESRHLVII